MLIPEPLAKRVRKAAQHKRQSTAAWMRHAVEAALKYDGAPDPLDELASLGAPTGDIDQILAEIGSGRC